MAKLIEYDVSNVESSGGTGVKVRPGLKVAEIVSITPRTQKSNGDPANDLQVILNFGEEYDWGYTYVGLGESSDWKMKELVNALGLKEKGKFDPDKQKGKLIRCMVKTGEYDGEYSPNIGKLFPPQPGDSVGSASMSSNGASGPDPEPGETDNDDGTPPISTAGGDICREDPDDPEVGSYDEWPDDDIAAEVEARGLTLPGGRGTAKAKGIKALRADDEEADAGGGADPVEAEAEPADGGDSDYDEWSDEDLQAEWESRQMGDLPAIRGRNREARLRAAIIEELRKDDAENPFEG